MEIQEVQEMGSSMRKRMELMRNIAINGCGVCKHFSKIACKKGTCALTSSELYALSGEMTTEFFKPCNDCPMPYGEREKGGGYVKE